MGLGANACITKYTKMHLKEQRLWTNVKKASGEGLIVETQ